MGWFRAYDGVSCDPKYLVVADRSGQPVPLVVAVWMAVLDCANQSEQRGEIIGFDAEAVASFNRVQPEAVEAILKAMAQAKRDGSPGMVTQCHDTSQLSVTAWRKRQPLREDETAAERKRRQRERERNEANQGDSGSVTLRHAASRPTRQTDKTEETDKTDRKKEEEIRAEPAAPSPEKAGKPGQAYRFQGRVIRLTERDYSAWQKAYSKLDLDPELQSLDDWLASKASADERKGWFHVVSGSLRKRNEVRKAGLAPRPADSRDVPRQTRNLTVDQADQAYAPLERRRTA